MGLAEELFAQRQGLLEKRFGLAVAPLRCVQEREIVEAGGDIGMGLAEAIARHCQTISIPGFRLPVGPLPLIK